MKSKNQPCILCGRLTKHKPLTKPSIQCQRCGQVYE